MKSVIKAKASMTGRHMVLSKSALADYEFEPLDEIRTADRVCLAVETLHPPANAVWMGPGLLTMVSGLVARDFSRSASDQSPHQKRPTAHIAVDISRFHRHYGGPDTQPNSGFREPSISGARGSYPDTRSSSDFEKFPNLACDCGHVWRRIADVRAVPSGSGESQIQLQQRQPGVCGPRRFIRS